MIFLIDYENVHANAFRGLMDNDTSFIADDKFYIFISGKDDKELNNLCSNVRKSLPACIPSYNVFMIKYNRNKSTCGSAVKNYNDFKIVTACIEFIKQNEQIAIISKDRGYKAVLDFYQSSDSQYLSFENKNPDIIFADTILNVIHNAETSAGKYKHEISKLIFEKRELENEIINMRQQIDNLRESLKNQTDIRKLQMSKSEIENNMLALQITKLTNSYTELEQKYNTLKTNYDQLKIEYDTISESAKTGINTFSNHNSSKIEPIFDSKEDNNDTYDKKIRKKAKKKAKSKLKKGSKKSKK